MMLPLMYLPCLIFLSILYPLYFLPNFFSPLVCWVFFFIIPAFSKSCPWTSHPFFFAFFPFPLCALHLFFISSILMFFPFCPLFTRLTKGAKGYLLCINVDCKRKQSRIMLFWWLFLCS